MMLANGHGPRRAVCGRARDRRPGRRDGPPGDRRGDRGRAAARRSRQRPAVACLGVARRRRRPRSRSTRQRSARRGCPPCSTAGTCSRPPRRTCRRRAARRLGKALDPRAPADDRARGRRGRAGQDPRLGRGRRPVRQHPPQRPPGGPRDRPAPASARWSRWRRPRRPSGPGGSWPTATCGRASTGCCVDAWDWVAVIRYEASAAAGWASRAATRSGSPPRSGPGAASRTPRRVLSRPRPTTAPGAPPAAPCP